MHSTLYQIDTEGLARLQRTPATPPVTEDGTGTPLRVRDEHHEAALARDERHPGPLPPASSPAPESRRQSPDRRDEREERTERGHPQPSFQQNGDPPSQNSNPGIGLILGGPLTA